LNEPDWIRDALAAFVGELRLFYNTAVGMTWRPRLFFAAWLARERRALNPVGFLATSVSVTAIFGRLLALALHDADEGQASLVSEVLDSLGPFVHYAAIGAECHLFLLAMCRSRPRLRSSLALALFAGGGPAMFARMVMELLFSALWVRGSMESGLARIAGTTMAAVVFAAFNTCLGSGLRVLFPASRVWQRFLALFAMMAVNGVLFGLLRPPGHYGLHLVIRFGSAVGVSF
jgi:hypothetical protein